MNKRGAIKLTPEEIAEFLATERVVNVASNGADGWPHLTALWFVMRDSEPWIYTYAKSQKVLNLERNPKATLLVEAGNEYQELRGVMLKATAEISTEIETVAPLAEEIFVKYQGNAQVDDATRDALRSQAAKRAAIRFKVDETVSWDHSKLGGGY